jgi:hypothetical protein
MIRQAYVGYDRIMFFVLWHPETEDIIFIEVLWLLGLDYTRFGE